MEFLTTLLISISLRLLIDFFANKLIGNKFFGYWLSPWNDAIISPYTYYVNRFYMFLYKIFSGIKKADECPHPPISLFVRIYQNFTTSGALVNELKVAVASFKNFSTLSMSSSFSKISLQKVLL